MSARFLSATVAGPRAIALEQRPLTTPQPQAVRVRLEGCGVCGSNLPVWEGRPWFSYPQPSGSPGHEGWGVIDEIGSEVEGLRRGDRVALLSRHAFAEYDFAEAAQVLPLPPALDGQPFPGEALGCAMNIFARCDIRARQSVAIVGVGFLGALLVNLAARAGARVLALSRRASALAVARRMGAAETLSLEDRAGAIQAVMELTGGAGCARVIEATGLGGPLDLAGELTAERGRLVIAGYHQDGPRQINLQLWNWRGLDVVNAHERDPEVYLRGVRAAIHAVVTGRLDPTPLYTDRFELRDVGPALDCLRNRGGTFLKSLVICS
ncbi:MAG TPA: zinc-binding dehydrogenase [Opitutus sp.]|nr:zinc-binding dehydrogenase [Opitutus sp.]